MASPTHALAPPFHLPGNQDATLLASLKDERWAEAVTLLRDVVTAETTEPKWLFLLAYSRFRDACEVMFEERLSAAQEALRLLDRAVAAGLPLREVAPFRREVETVLDQETRAELATLAKLPEPGQSLEGVDTEVLTDAGYTLWSSEPRRAGECFEEVARRQRGQTPGPVGHLAGSRGAVLRRRARLRPSQAALRIGARDRLGPRRTARRTKPGRESRDRAFGAFDRG